MMVNEFYGLYSQFIASLIFKDFYKALYVGQKSSLFQVTLVKHIKDINLKSSLEKLQCKMPIKDIATNRN